MVFYLSDGLLADLLLILPQFLFAIDNLIIIHSPLSLKFYFLNSCNFDYPTVFMSGPLYPKLPVSEAPFLRPAGPTSLTSGRSS